MARMRMRIIKQNAISTKLNAKRKRHLKGDLTVLLYTYIGFSARVNAT